MKTTTVDSTANGRCRPKSYLTWGVAGMPGHRWENFTRMHNSICRISLASSLWSTEAMNFHLEATAVSKKPLEFLTDRAARRRAGGCFRARVLRQSLLSSKNTCLRTKILCSGRSDICALCRGDVFCGSFLAPEAAAGWFNGRRFVDELYRVCSTGRLVMS